MVVRFSKVVMGLEFDHFFLFRQKMENLKVFLILFGSQPLHHLWELQLAHLRVLQLVPMRRKIAAVLEKPI